MQYRALRDNFYDGRYYYSGRVYSFNSPPSHHFEPMQLPVEETVTDSQLDEKRELIDQAEALGIEVDKRWGIKKLREVVEAT
jgi:hypothetical protein